MSGIWKRNGLPVTRARSRLSTAAYVSTRLLRAEGGHRPCSPVWPTAFWDANRMQPPMKIAMTREAVDAAEVESVVREWLGEQISHRRAQRTNEDEGQPEQQGARNLRAEVGGRDERQRASEEVVTRARGRPSSSRISRFGQTNQPHKTIARELVSLLPRRKKLGVRGRPRERFPNLL
jgi:hypothetical protein